MVEPGELIASGRAADVYDQGDGTVLRRYRTDRDSSVEAEAMVWLRGVGFPVPEVRDAAGRDLLMRRVVGPTMLADLESRPWMAASHMRTLAGLQRRLNALDAPEWLRADVRIPAGRSVVHLDLHPMNVILGPSGPVVIDWTNVRRSDGDFDAAMSFVIMAAFEVHGPREIVAKRTLLQLFRSFRGARAIGRRLAEAAELRLLDPNVTPGEHEAIVQLLTRATTRRGTRPGRAGRR